MKKALDAMDVIQTLQQKILNVSRTKNIKTFNLYVFKQEHQ